MNFNQMPDQNQIKIYLFTKGLEMYTYTSDLTLRDKKSQNWKKLAKKRWWYIKSENYFRSPPGNLDLEPWISSDTLIEWLHSAQLVPW